LETVMEQGKNFEDKLTQQLKRATDQLVAAQARGGVELEERLAAMLREHLYHYPVADEAVARIVVTLNALPEWLRTGLAYGGHVDQLVAVAAGVFALGNGAGRWMLVDLNTGLVSVELWPTAAEAADAAAGVLSLPVCAKQYGDRTISWSEPVGDDEPADDEYELATCIGCGCDDGGGVKACES